MLQWWLMHYLFATPKVERISRLIQKDLVGYFKAELNCFLLKVFLLLPLILRKFSSPKKKEKKRSIDFVGLEHSILDSIFIMDEVIAVLRKSD